VGHDQKGATTSTGLQDHFLGASRAAGILSLLFILFILSKPFLDLPSLVATLELVQRTALTG